MVGSSLRNSIHRRNHKERGQLANRSRLGLLEKHKDYVQRARDYNSKKDRLKRLKEKASFRNKDEFYFGMVNSKTEGGVHVKSRGNVALPMDTVKILKTQDENYVRTQRAVELNKIERTKAQLTALADLIPSSTATSSRTPTFGDDDGDGDMGAGFEDMESEDEELEEKLREAEQATLLAAGLLSDDKKRKGKGRAVPRKIVFKETRDEVLNYDPSSSTSSSSQPVASTSATSTTESNEADLGWVIPEPKKKSKSKVPQLTPTEAKVEDDKARRVAAKKHRLSLLRTLQAHVTRESALRSVEKEMTLQRNLMGKGSKKKISPGGRQVAQVGDDAGDDDEEDERGGRKGEWKGRTFKWKAERRK